jgi:hypothetical protein
MSDVEDCNPVDFVTEIPAEKKYLLELKWNIHISGRCTSDNKMDWAAILVDNKGKTITMKCDKDVEIPFGLSETQIQMRGEVCAILASVGHLLDMYDEKTKPYLDISIVTESTYLFNLCTDYIHIWATELFANRPNADVIAQLHMVMSQLGNNLTIDWVPTNTSEYAKLMK